MEAEDRLVAARRHGPPRLAGSFDQDRVARRRPAERLHGRRIEELARETGFVDDPQTARRAVGAVGCERDPVPQRLHGPGREADGLGPRELVAVDVAGARVDQ